MINAKGGGYAAYPGLVLICRHIFNYHTVPLNICNYYVSIKLVEGLPSIHKVLDSIPSIDFRVLS